MTLQLRTASSIQALRKGHLSDDTRQKVQRKVLKGCWLVWSYPRRLLSLQVLLLLLLFLLRALVAFFTTTLLAVPLQLAHFALRHRVLGRSSDCTRSGER